MTKPLVTEVNATTGESVTREMTDIEFEQWEKDSIESENHHIEIEAQNEAKAAAKASALAKLAALGLTEEESQALVKQPGI